MQDSTKIHGFPLHWNLEMTNAEKFLWEKQCFLFTELLYNLFHLYHWPTLGVIYNLSGVILKCFVCLPVINSYSWSLISFPIICEMAIIMLRNGSLVKNGPFLWRRWNWTVSEVFCSLLLGVVRWGSNHWSLTRICKKKKKKSDAVQFHLLPHFNILTWLGIKSWMEIGI